MGGYRVGKLVELGEYEEFPGEFVKKKIQGFLRVPVSGYVIFKTQKEDREKVDVVKLRLRDSLLGRGGSNLNFLDKVILLQRFYAYIWKGWDTNDLVRLGVLVKGRMGNDEVYNYDDGRLFEYTRDKFFDWLVASEELSAAVLDVSGLDLGEDVVRFLENLGVDVVMIRKGDKEIKKNDESKLIVAEKELLKSKTAESLRDLLGINRIEVGNVDAYRSDVLLVVGRDLENMF